MSKLYSLPLSRNYGIVSVYALFDGNVFLYADETKHLWPHLCEFLG